APRLAQGAPRSEVAAVPDARGHQARALERARRAAQARGRAAARDVHRRPRRRHPICGGQRSLGRTQRRRGAARARRAADRRALPVQLEERRADAERCLIMQELESLRTRLPEFAKDARLNLQTVLEGASLLSSSQRWGVAVTSAAVSRNRELLEAVIAQA